LASYLFEYKEEKLGFYFEVNTNSDLVRFIPEYPALAKEFFLICKQDKTCFPFNPFEEKIPANSQEKPSQDPSRFIPGEEASAIENTEKKTPPKIPPGVIPDLFEEAEKNEAGNPYRVPKQGLPNDQNNEQAPKKSVKAVFDLLTKPLFWAMLLGSAVPLTLLVFAGTFWGVWKRSYVKLPIHESILIFLSLWAISILLKAIFSAALINTDEVIRSTVSNLWGPLILGIAIGRALVKWRQKKKLVPAR